MERVRKYILEKAMKNKIYITTPIYYVNDKPHIGHAYTTILADVLARYHKAEGDNVFFLTGLDEHGQKVQQAAQERNLSEQAHCDDLAPRFTQLWEKLEIQNTDFIRTTENRHIKVVQNALQKVYDAGDIYADEYTVISCAAHCFCGRNSCGVWGVGQPGKKFFSGFGLYGVSLFCGGQDNKEG